MWLVRLLVPSRIFSPSVTAFCALEKARFRLVCSPGLLGPVISDVILAFLALDTDFRVYFHLLQNFDLLCYSHGFSQFSGRFIFQRFREPAAAKKNEVLEQVEVHPKIRIKCE